MAFEPRSNTSRRNIHQHEYARSFAGASQVLIAVPAKTDKVPEGRELDLPRLAREVSATGIPTEAVDGVPAIAERIAGVVRSGDVVLVMSNGAFGGLVELLLQRIGVPR